MADVSSIVVRAYLIFSSQQQRTVLLFVEAEIASVIWRDEIQTQFDSRTCALNSSVVYMITICMTVCVRTVQGTMRICQSGQLGLGLRKASLRK